MGEHGQERSEVAELWSTPGSQILPSPDLPPPQLRRARVLSLSSTIELGRDPAAAHKHYLKVSEWVLYPEGAEGLSPGF